MRKGVNNVLYNTIPPYNYINKNYSTHLYMQYMQMFSYI